MAKTYEIAFKLAGKLSGGFTKAFQSASEAVQGVDKQLNTLNKQASDTGKLVKMRREVGNASREYIKAKQKVAELGKAMNSTDQPTKEMVANFKKAQKEVSKAKASLDKKKSSLRALDSSMGTADKSLKDLIKREKELADAAEKARISQEKLAKINEKLDKANEAKDKASGAASATIGQAAGMGAAVGAGVGAAAGWMLKSGTESTAALNKLQAQTGMTNAEMEKLEKTAYSIYKSGMGESFEEVTASMATVKQTSGLAGDELKKATSNALLLKDTFEFDVNESARTASALMKNFGISADEAYGIIAKGAQSGANKNGDLLDTLNEYSVHYKTLGFDADQFVTNLIKGAESGAFSVDKVGDAIKEFTIRSKDGSKTSLEAFAALGLNGEKMTKAFAKGGDSASKAFFQTVEALEAMDDPVAKNAAGVALFGTMYEDLESGALESMLAMKGATIDATGTLENIKKVQYDDLGSQIDVLGRKFTTSLAPSAQQAADTLKNNMPQIEASMKPLSAAVSSAGQAFADALPGIIDWVSKALTKVTEFAKYIADNWGTIGPIVGGLLKAFLGYKALTVIAAPVITLYKGFLNLKKGIELAKNSTVLHTAASKANAAASKVAAGAAKLWNGAISVAKLVAQKAALVASKVATVAWTVACKLAAGAQLALNAAIGFITSPIGIAIAAIAAIIAIGVLLYKNWDKVKAGALALWEGIKSAWSKLKAATSEAWSSVVSACSKAWAKFKAFGSYIWGGFKTAFVNAWQAIRDKISSIFSGLVGIIKKPLNAVISLVNKAIGKINGISVDIPDWVPGMGGKTLGFNIPKIPQLAEGGITTGPTFAEIGEGREQEAVLPLSKLDGLLSNRAKQGGGNMTVTFSPVINVSGGGQDAYAQVKRGLDEGQKSLKRELEKLMRNQQRLSYA